VGGHALITMADLKKSFEKMSLKNVRTVLASGNVVFESEQKETAVIIKEIESGLKLKFNRDINVILRSLDDLKKLQSSEPFKGITVTPGIQLYVTFLSEKSRPRTMVIPYTSPQKEFSIVHATPREIFSIVYLSKGKGTPGLMNMLGKEFGSEITTRNWNTLLKILK
jgi:uncharacterized protein (DUF1697 family)